MTDQHSSGKPAGMSPQEVKLRAALSESPAFRALGGEAVALPEVEAPSLEGLRVTVPPLKPVDAAKVLAELSHAVQVRDLRERARGERVHPNDWLVVDAVAFCDGRCVPFSVEERRKLGWGERDTSAVGLRPAFDGAEVGPELQLPLALPPNFPVVALRNRKAVLAARVWQAFEVPQVAFGEPPAAAELLGGGLGAVSREAAAHIAVREREAHGRLREWRVVEALLGRTRSDVPDALIDQEIGRVWTGSEGRLLRKLQLPAADQDASLAAWLADPAIRQQTRRSLAVAQLLLALAKSQRIAVSEAEFRELLETIASEARIPSGGLARQLAGDPQELAGVAVTALFSRTLAAVMSQQRIEG